MKYWDVRERSSEPAVICPALVSNWTRSCPHLTILPSTRLWHLESNFGGNKDCCVFFFCFYSIKENQVLVHHMFVVVSGKKFIAARQYAKANCVHEWLKWRNLCFASVQKICSALVPQHLVPNSEQVSSPPPHLSYNSPPRGCSEAPECEQKEYGHIVLHLVRTAPRGNMPLLTSVRRPKMWQRSCVG